MHFYVSKNTRQVTCKKAGVVHKPLVCGIVCVCTLVIKPVHSAVFIIFPKYFQMGATTVRQGVL